MFHIETLNDVLLLAAGRGAGAAMQWRQPDGAWKTISGTELLGRVRRLANVLTGWGVQKGDRVALLAENRWEWPVIDFAALSLGAIDVPLYATTTAEQVGYMLRDSGAKVLFVSSQEQLTKFRGAGDLPSLEHVVVLDDHSEGAESFSALLAQPFGTGLDEGAFEESLNLVRPEDPATIIYTSGTTGDPKGVLLTHANFVSNLNVSTCDFNFDNTDSSISFLPLSHVTARHVDYALLCHGATLAYLPKFDLLPEALRAIRPTVFVAVPRVYEKIRQVAESRAMSSPLRARIFQSALGVGRRYRQQTLRGETPKGVLFALADRLVFAKVREAFGGRVKIFISGGAPLGEGTPNWYADSGIRILEGYGLTETSPVIAVNTPRGSKVGAAGKPLPNLDLRFAPDGELEVRGPSVFGSYWQHEKETREAFTADGWFKTGDIGRLEDGFLFITDRKKELLKTSGGKLIAPQPIENQLKTNSLIGHAALVGDGQKFASVLISPNFQVLEAWAKENGLSASDRKALVGESRVTELYRGIVDLVNGKLAQYETMKKVGIVPDDWTVESGELTPSMKLKRRVIEKKYADEISSFYKEAV